MRASLLQIRVDPAESVNSRRARVASLVREQGAADLVVLPELWPVGAFASDLFADGGGAARRPDARRDGVGRAGRRGLAARRIRHRAGVGRHAVQHLAGLLPRRPARRDLPQDPPLRLRPGRGHAAGRRRPGRDGPACRRPRWAWPPATTCASPSSSGSWWRTARSCWWSPPAGPPGAVRTGRCWPAPAPWRTSPMCWRAAPPAPTRVSSRPGYSVVVDPWGEVLAEAGPDEEVLTVDLDPARVAKTRADFPVLRDRVLGLDRP